MTTATPPQVADLDADRRERAAARAAARAGRGETLPIRFGGQTIAVIGAEFPLDVLEPFADVNLDIALLVRQAIDLAQAESGDQQLSTLDMIVSVLASNPNLPREVLAAGKEAGKRLLSEEGYSGFMGQRPTPWDFAALGRHLLSWWGVNLGELSSSSTPSGDGRTSNPTSPATTPASTPTPPGPAQVPPASSEYAVSPL
jgi:hypothetical protein